MSGHRHRQDGRGSPGPKPGIFELNLSLLVIIIVVLGREVDSAAVTSTSDDAHVSDLLDDHLENLNRVKELRSKILERRARRGYNSGPGPGPWSWNTGMISYQRDASGSSGNNSNNSYNHSNMRLARKIPTKYEIFCQETCRLNDACTRFCLMWCNRTNLMKNENSKQTREEICTPNCASGEDPLSSDCVVDDPGWQHPTMAPEEFPTASPNRRHRT